MKKTTFYMLLAALIIMLMASCTTGKHTIYKGNYSKYNWHGHQLKKQVDSLYKSDTTGKCLVAIINGKPVLVCK